MKARNVSVQRNEVVPGMGVGKSFRNVCFAVGVLSIVADVATIPRNSYIGTVFSPSSGSFAFYPLLWPFNLPMLNIVGMFLGLAAMTSAFTSERMASVLVGTASGFALTLSTSLGSLTYGHFDVGWPLAWAHRLDTFGPPSTSLLFYLDVTGLLMDLAFWMIVMGLGMGLLRHYLHSRMGSH